MHKLRTDSGVVGSSQDDPIWNENKWQIKLDLNWENKSIFPNYIIELMREKEKEKEGRENFKNKIAQIIFISY